MIHSQLKNEFIRLLKMTCPNLLGNLWHTDDITLLLPELTWTSPAIAPVVNGRWVPIKRYSGSALLILPTERVGEPADFIPFIGELITPINLPITTESVGQYNCSIFFQFEKSSDVLVEHVVVKQFEGSLNGYLYKREDTEL